MAANIPVQMLKSIKQPAAVVDSSYIYTFVNKAFCEYHQISQEEIVGRHVEQITGSNNFRHRFKPHFDQCLRGEEVSFDFRPIGSENSDTISQIHLYPCFSDGDTVDSLVVISDIQDTRKSFQELRERERRFRLLAEYSTDIVYTTDIYQQFTFISPSVEKILGYTVNEALTMNARDIMTEASYQDQLEAFRKILADPQSNPETTEVKALELIRKDGSKLWGEVHARLLLDKSNQPYGVLGICRDITQRKMLENELWEAKEKAEENERLKTAFLANLSHEIRTPLNIILGYVQLLDKPDLSPENREQYIDAIYNSSDHLIDIINDVLSMAKLETGQQSLQINPFNLNSLIQETYYSFEPKARRNNIRFDINIPSSDNPIELRSDENKVRQILANLLNNAFKFTPEGGEISFGYSMDNGNVHFFVKDNGIGIPGEHHERIFERFTQLEDSDKRKYEGTGLGLPISRGLVELLGGNIQVESKSDKGATFSFFIPAANND